MVGWVDDYFGAGIQPQPSTPPLPKPTPERPPGTGIVVEPLADGRYRLDMQGLNLEIRPAEGGGYLVTPPELDEPDAARRGPLGALDQAVDRRAGEEHRVARAAGRSSSARSSSPGSSTGSPD